MTVFARWAPKAELELVRPTENGVEYRYRGAKLVTGAPKEPTYNAFWLEGHPYSGLQRGQLLECQRLVDAWLDEDRLPDPYVGPRRVR